MDKLRIIGSLHRPYHIPLKSTKWVCLFIAQNKKKGKELKQSEFYSEFFFYLIHFLHTKYYAKEVISQDFQDGIPSKETVQAIFNYFTSRNYIEKKECLRDILVKKREEGLEKQIYSTYKATSYYINLSKEKFQLIGRKYELTDDGRKLSNSRKLSKSDKRIFFERILLADIHAFLPICLLQKYSKDIQYLLFKNYLSLYKGKGHRFEYNTNESIENYFDVRNAWIKQLDILDKRNNIRKIYKEFIQREYFNYYNDIINSYKQIVKKEVTEIKKYNINKDNFIKIYKSIYKKGLSDNGYINLYDIKQEMRLSYEKLQAFLQDFYEKEKNNYPIFFSNIVTSIDARKRFNIRNIPVLKIKIIL